ncbi:hypothetical protein [Microvirga sp. P5_D2]
MKYTINALYLPQGSVRPVANEQIVDVEADDNRFVLKPDIGDHVRLPKEDGSTALSGCVKSRLFSYAASSCHVDVIL